MQTQQPVRLTQYAHGGGCACKIPPGELEEAVARLVPEHRPDDLLIGVEPGDANGSGGVDGGRRGLPLPLPKPLGSGSLSAMHKATGEVSEAGVEVMTTLNADASRAALRAGLRCATDVTGFGLLGHAFKLARASGVSAVIDHRAVPVIDGVLAAQRAGHLPGGSRRNLAWVAPHADFSGLSEEVLLLLADAQTSGGLLIAGEIPGAPVIGELVPRGDCVISVI